MRFIESLTYDWITVLNFSKRPFRAKFIPAKIWKDLDKYKNDSVGLSNYAKKWRCKIEWKKELSKAKLWKVYVGVGGEYDPETRQIIMLLHTADFNTHSFENKTWNRFKYNFIQTLMHELIHFMQFDRRDDNWSNYVVPYKKVGHKKKDDQRRYLSEFDEIQAYAHCVYLDFKTYKSKYTLEELVSRSNKKVDSRTLNFFLKTFDYDYTNNMAIPKLMEQIFKWDRKYKRVNLV